jgi:alkanesulfonate monooxygenase SsuD/methylene tetrahydromethanopterin reductase-like flavin-dependent oxidoreductase (luciferase family)
VAFTMMRLNFVHPDPTDAEHMGDRYRAGVDLAEYADKNGFAMVTLEEHQATEIGWSPTPLLNAAMILNRTENLSIAITALLVPLHDPVRLAQEMAVIDLVSKGRLSITTGLGYRPVEYAAVGKEWKRRGKILDHNLETMLKVWSGEEFELNGETIKVGPMPYTRPHPMVMIGGSGPAAARRAARFGLPLQLPAQNPEVEALYYEECEKNGTSGFCIAPENVAMVHVVDDPDKAWAELGHHFWLEASTYDSWQPEGQTSAVHTHATNVDELRAEGIYQFLSPEQAVDRIRETGALSLHPLVGGMPIDSAWQSLELTVDKVLPALEES